MSYQTNFVNEIAEHAQRIEANYNILASLVISQAIHESNWGRSGLATRGKNLFGIKGSYNGQSITMPTWEVINGKNVTVDAAFRLYPSWYESLEDLARLYTNGLQRESRNRYAAVLGEKDYKRAAQAVADAGYATDPAYAAKVIRTIEAHNLTRFDGQAPKEQPKQEEPKQEQQPTGNVYIVKAGDTLGQIAARNKTTVAALAKLNNIKNVDLIRVGQRIQLPGAAAAPAAQYHTVKAGDIVSRIAQRYGTTTAAVKKLNPGIKNINLIFPGQRIRVK